MHSKRKSATFNLVAIFVLLVVFLCCIGSLTYATAESSKPQVSDEIGIEAMASNKYEDFSSYTDQQLPSSLSKSNISQYVPVSKFNTNGTTVYNGRNYGFVIFSDTRTNHILLFKEEYITHTDDGGYDVKLQVVYENSFFKSGNTIINANSPYHISLSNIKIENAIFDTDLNDNIASNKYSGQNDGGAYYTQAITENQVSFFNKGVAEDYAIAVTTCVVSIGLGLICPPAGLVGLAGTAVTALGMVPVLDELANDGLWLDETTVNTAINFPMTRQAQLQQYGGLRKNLQVQVKDDNEEYISKSGDYTKTSFRVMNDNNKDYYVANRISFDISRYSSLEHHKVDSSSIQSVYSVTGTNCKNYSRMSEQDETFGYDNYYRIAPIINGNIFNFVPDVMGKYSIIVPSGYYITVDGTAQLSNFVNIDSRGCKIGVAPTLETNTGDKLYSRLLAEDFYNGEIKFANIFIQKTQQLNIDKPTNVQDLAYTVESSSTDSNDLYIIEAGENVNEVDLYITNNNMEVVAKAVKKGNKLYINYPMKANELYGLICVNRTGLPLDFTVMKEFGMTADSYPHSEIAGLYYSYSPKYTQFYNTESATLFDVYMNEYSSVGAFLQAGEHYFLRSQGDGKMSVFMSDQAVHTFGSVGEVFESQNVFNEAFRFTPLFTSQYQFADGTYDVYEGETLISHDANQCVLQKDVTYLIVKKQYGGITKIYLDGESLSYGANEINPTSPYTVYKLCVEEKSRLDISMNNSASIIIYDSALNLITLDHGYLLEQGEYYVIVNYSGTYSINIGEFIQQVNITFYIDGKIYTDNSGSKYYYGKCATLPIPSKVRHDFNGWKLNGILITDNNGVTYGELLADKMNLVADWTLRGLVMEINMLNGTSKWWTGEQILPQQPDEVYIEGEMIDLLVNLKSDFIKMTDSNKQGYFLDTFEYSKTKSLGIVDYYEFTPVWKVEKYYIEFISPDATYATARAVSYGEKMSSPVFPTQAFGLEANALFVFKGWQLSNDSDVFTLQFEKALFDLTPGYGSEYNYDSNGDGKFDSTLVRLSSVVDYVDYTVRIKDKSYKVPYKGNYKIETLESYGYDASEYYGKNVLLKTSDESKIYAFGGEVPASDLMSFWTSGSHSVTVDLSISAENIEVTLTYDYSGSGNATTYKGEENVVLVGGNVYKKGYKFEYWTVDGKKIEMLSYANLGINEYYSDTRGKKLSKTLIATWSRVTLRPTSLVNYTISDEDILVDLSRFNLMVGIKFTIAPSAKEVTFANGNCNDTSIIVSEREDKLIINFNNVTINAKRSESALDASKCPNLVLYSFNKVTLRGGEASLNAGGNAIICNNLTLLGNNFYIYGGSSLSYNYNGRAGIYSNNSNCTLTIGASNVKVTGGAGCLNSENKKPLKPSDDDFEQVAGQGQNGENGANGYVGTHGAVAIYYILNTVKVNSGCTLECIGGAGGNGGNGKNGQRGGNGKDGAFLVPHVKSGNGGKGGDGGKGGNGGKPMICGNLVKNGANYVPRDGEAGKGGYGGYGAPPGTPGYTIGGKPDSGYWGRDGQDGIGGTAGISTYA